MKRVSHTPKNPRHARALLATLAALPALALSPTTFAASSAWNVTTAGNWSLGSNWSAGVPGATSGTTSTDIATFTRSTIIASRLITLDTDYNVGGLTFNNDTNTANIYQIGGTTFGGATTGTLNFSAGAQILVNGSGTSTSGANGLDAKIVLNGNTTFSNTYQNTVFNLGNSAGTTANTFTTANALGNIDLTFTGTSTGSSLQSMQITQGTGTTLRLVKDGAGTWQFNGKTSGNQGFTGGFLVRQGTAVIGRSSALSIGTGTFTVGDGSTVAGDIHINLGSSVNVSNAITVAASSADNVYFERGGGSGAGTFSGPIAINRNVIFRQSTTANQSLTVSGAITGTGDVTIASLVASPGAVNFSNANALNMVGKFTNASTSATGTVTVSGIVGSNVTELVQNSSTSAMSLTSASNAFDKTTISLGTLSTGATGRFGSGNISVAGGASLNLGNNSSLQDTTSLFFGSTSLINLGFTGTDTVNMLALQSIGSTYITPGTYNASQLNSFFGGSVFSGTGSLLVLAAIPEPSSFTILAGLAGLGFASMRRRSRR